MVTRMNLLKDRAHHLINQLTDEELKSLWPTLTTLYYDFYMLRAIAAAKQSLQPGDTLTREEAMQVLSLPSFRGKP